LKTFFRMFFVFFAAFTVSFAVLAADPKFDKDDISSIREYAENGSPEAQYYLALHYENEKNMEEAARWYRKSAEQNDLDAQYKLGLCYDKGEGVKQDHAEAVKWYQKAADRGIVEAQIALGACYENGKGVEKSISEAVKWYRMAADRKNPEAQYKLGYCYETYGEIRSDDKAAIWYRRAAELGSAEAQYKLGRFYETGKGVEKSVTDAVHWYAKAAAQGILDAAVKLGRYYESGAEGLPRDMAAAIKWYRKAAELGSAEAQAKVEQYAGKQRQEESVRKVEKSGEKMIITFSNGLKLVLIKVEAGTFVMSKKDGDNQYDEIPHQVTLKRDFYIGQTEVTQAQWKAVMGTKPWYFNGDYFPVEKVSWNDAMAFCDRLNVMGKTPGWRFTLPTETQWEYAARGGKKSKGYKYSGSDNIDEVAWYEGNSSGKTHPVGKKKANELGLYDMSGNVPEWCLDNWQDRSDKLTAEFTRGNDQSFYGPRPYPCRGGDRLSSASFCRSAYRRSVYYTSDWLPGFRLALVPESY